MKSLCEQQSMAPCAEGRGSVVDEHTVTVELSAGGTKTLTTKYILIATGGKPVKAPIPGSVRPLTTWEIVPSSASCDSLCRLGIHRQQLFSGGTCSGCGITCQGARGRESFCCSPAQGGVGCTAPQMPAWPEFEGHRKHGMHA